MRVGPRMPRYYFDIENGQPYRDEIGEDFSRRSRRLANAVRSTREIEDMLAPGGVWRLQVSNQQQAPIIELGANCGANLVVR